jgi:hypothetical protein
MNNLIVFTLSLIAIGLCTLHFSCGYWLAQSRQAKRRRGVRSGWAPEFDRVAYQAAVNTLLEQALQVCTVSSSGKPDAVNEAIAKLGKVANAVERSTCSYDFTPTELKSLTTQPDGAPLQSDGQLCTERRPYPTWQYVTPYTDSLPDPTEFKDVYCHDISVGGISYLSPEVPTDMQVCISVGTAPDWLLMEAQVANYRLVQYKGLPMYLIGCRFSRRIGKFSELWPGQRVAFGRPISIHPLPTATRSTENITHQLA